MLQVFLDVAYVAMIIHVCCKCLFKIFYLLQTYVARCLIMMLHMLQWLYTYVVNVCSKCFICFRHMLQEVLFYVASVSWASESDPRVRDTDITKVDLDVVYVAMAIYVCYRYLFKVFHLLQTYDPSTHPSHGVVWRLFLSRLVFRWIECSFWWPEKNIRIEKLIWWNSFFTSFH
jgi:hypothetical protein